MTTSFTKRTTTDFLVGKGCFADLLEQELSVALRGAKIPTVTKPASDTVNISWNVGLDEGEIATQDAIIASHDPRSAYKSLKLIKSFQVAPEIRMISSVGRWFLVSSFVYEGRNAVGPIVALDIISYMTSGLTSYSVQIVNTGPSRNKNELVALNTFTNITKGLNSVEPILLIPSERSVLQCSIKVNGEQDTTNNRCVHIGDLVVRYGGH